MDYNKIFNRFASASEKRTIDFDAMNMDEKIAYLKENSTVTIEADQKYEVSKTVKKSDYENLTDYFKAGITIGASAEELIAAESVTKSVKIYGKDLTKRDTINVLSKGADINGGQITVDRFGGSNFVNFCKWVREMGEDEFETLCNTK